MRSNTTTLVLSFAFGCSAMAGGISPAAAQEAAADYPNRAIRMVVPFPPGGSNDIIGRYYANYLTERLNKQVVVDNRGGADGVIGTEIVARAAPDGYTLLIASAAHAVNGAIRKLPYDPVKSFAWIAMLGLGPSVLTVNAGLPANNLKELLAYGKANPGKLTLSSSGGYAQFVAELFHYMSGLQLTVVVYKGGMPALLDTMGGQVPLNIGSLIQTLPHMKTGKIRALATTGAKRAAATPDLPTIAEAGIPGYEANNTWAAAAPAGTPDAIVNKLSAEAARYLKLPDTAKRFAAEGAEMDYRTPAETRQLVPVEIAKWAKVAKLANIKTE